MPELTATLVIGVTSSTCGNCNQPTMPTVDRHTDVSGWSPQRGAGCGARFVDMQSDSPVVTDWHLKQVRPDLPVRGHEPIQQHAPTAPARQDSTRTGQI